MRNQLSAKTHPSMQLVTIACALCRLKDIGMSSTHHRYLQYCFFVLLVLTSCLSASECVEVVTADAVITRSPSSTSPALATVWQEERFLVLGRFRNLIKVEYKGKGGWIQKDQIRYIVCPDNLSIDSSTYLTSENGSESITFFFQANRNIIAAVIFLIVVIVIVLIAVKMDLKPRHHEEDRYVMILGDPHTRIIESEEAFAVSFADLFNKNNLHFASARLFPNVKRHLSYYIPDVFLVDWNFSPTIAADLDRLLMDVTTPESVLVIFYNIPGELIARQNLRIAHVQFFTSRISGKELLKNITTFLTHRGRRTAIQIRRKVPASALEGELREGSLSEVFQMVEMGAKTGCLIVNNLGPFGMVGFENGLITYAATKSHKERDAVMDILNLSTGDFKFIANIPPKSRNCTIATIEVLMSWAQKKDEEKRDDS